MDYRVNEIFKSIEGEGKRTGLPSTFIRLAGCNLRCSYCDTAYALKANDGMPMTVDEIDEKVGELHSERLTITGGEPMLQDVMTLARELRPYECNIETNGSIPLVEKSDNVFYTMDWKSIGSGHSDDMLERNLTVLDEDDVIKFVVQDEADLEQMKEVLTGYDVKAQPYVSPVYGKIEPRKIVRYVLENGLDIHVQVQLHKIIWEPDKRGV